MVPNLAQIGLLSFINYGVNYLLCVIDVFSKYSWIKSLKYKKGKTVFHDLVEIINESKPKTNNKWADQARQFARTTGKNG